jgi:Na+-transporting NADH:ubiquinone oxidoreductase subunit NqrF
LPESGEKVRVTGTQSKVHGGKTHTNPMAFVPTPGGAGSAAMFGHSAEQMKREG